SNSLFVDLSVDNMVLTPLLFSCSAAWRAPAGGGRGANADGEISSGGPSHQAVWFSPGERCGPAAICGGFETAIIKYIDSNPLFL
ncbi:MAG TPA: hypothetical protein P5055_10905, partial [Candidatus Paceibacterota bacterium]|nr:hypothetical protein [Candidatus Paceibacterota bacterium]